MAIAGADQWKLYVSCIKTEEKNVQNDRLDEKGPRCHIDAMIRKNDHTGER